MLYEDFFKNQMSIFYADILDDICMKDDLENLRDKLTVLNERELKVITLRYGLDDEIPHTLEEIGKVVMNDGCKLTRERIRQIKKESFM